MTQPDPLFFLNHQSYGTYNRALARSYGLAPAVLLGDLVEKRRYHYERDELTNDPKRGPGWCYHTVDGVHDRTGINKDQQASAIKVLIGLGFIEMATFGMPCKRYFRLNDQKILEFFFPKKIDTKLREASDQGAGSLHKVEESLQLAGGKPPSHLGADTYNKEHKEKSTKEESLLRRRSSDNSEAPLAPAPAIADAKEISCFSPSRDEGPPKPPPKIKRADQVATTDQEHAKLLAAFEADLVQAAYEDLSEWKQSAKPAQVKKHTSDYYRLRKWVIPQLRDAQEKARKAVIAPWRRDSKMVTEGDYEPSTYRRRRL